MYIEIAYPRTSWAHHSISLGLGVRSNKFAELREYETAVVSRSGLAYYIGLSALETRKLAVRLQRMLRSLCTGKAFQRLFRNVSN